MNTTAERLKGFREAFDVNRGSGGEREVLCDYAEIMLDNLTEILAALQFAEDMQTIAKAWNAVAVFPEGTMANHAVISELGGKRVEFEGTDIFTAARAAAEQVKGGT